MRLCWLGSAGLPDTANARAVGRFIIPILLSVLFHGRVHLMLKRQALSSASRVRMYEERLRAASLSTADPR